jgi:hypothetical protein
MNATNLANKSSPKTPVCDSEWRMSETNLVPSAICGVKTEHWRPKPTETCEEPVTS